MTTDPPSGIRRQADLAPRNAAVRCTDSNWFQISSGKSTDSPGRATPALATNARNPWAAARSQASSIKSSSVTSPTTASP